MPTMLKDVQEAVGRVVFVGGVPGSSRENWLHFENGDSTAWTLLVDHTRANASRVNKLWHTLFRAWLEQEMAVEARKAWVAGVKMGLDMCNFIDLDEYQYGDDKRAQYTVWLKNESLFGAEFVCREGRGKKKKGLYEVVVLYAVCHEYRRMHGVAKTAAKKQAKKIKKKIIGVPDAAFVHPDSRSLQQSVDLAVWQCTTSTDLLAWFAEQHTRMCPVTQAVVCA